MAFTTFLGIDQTGAVRADGTPRPLDAAMLVLGARPRLVTAKLAAASREVIAAWVRDEGGDLAAAAILVDAVIGLPDACWPSWTEHARGGDRAWSLFARAAAWPGWGRGVAEAFFATLWQRPSPATPLPRRACELASGANSVFVTRPFQKNVQTGTFRLWKDLASSGERWANVWAFDRGSSVDRRAPWLFEGYPSLLWARVFGFARRSPLRARELFGQMRARAPGLAVDRALVARLEASPDLADAAVLALGGALLDAEGRLLRPFPSFVRHPAVAREGWIVGLPAA